MSLKTSILLVMCPLALAAGFQRTGTTAAQFLKLPVSARAAALGDAGLALSLPGESIWGGAETLLLNPAALADSRGPRVAVSQQRLLGQLDHGVAAWTRPLGDHSAWGLGLNWLSVANQEITTETEPSGTGAEYSYGDLALSVGGGWRLNERLSAGLTGRYLRQSLHNEEASGLSADLSLLLALPWREARLAVAIQNFGTRLQLEGDDLLLPGSNQQLATLSTQDFAQPLIFKLAMAGELWHDGGQRLEWSAQAEHPNDNRRRLGLGLEYSLKQQLALRVGRRFRSDLESWSAGVGVRTAIPGTPLTATVDAAWVATRYFQDQRLFSLGVTF
ncbi:MAG: PorV/PorQ family protein [Candidatus Cloacimonetes bacterium]|nr:PorV/PorQ family protein [Candidatus Cloacimonadota bacterium]